MSKRLQLSIAQGAVFTLGVYHALLGLIMIVVPTWFYDNIGERSAPHRPIISIILVTLVRISYRLG